MKATVFDIQRNSYVDGPGIRTTVFFKGCNLRCKWCHSPESQSFEKQVLFYKDKCTGCGRCKAFDALDEDFICFEGAKEICGKEYTDSEILSEVMKDKIFYDMSGGGVTFSGGECMLQVDFLTEILKKCKENGISTAIDTAGNVPFESFEKVLPYTDMFLYDVKAVDSDKHVKYTGVTNALILENLKKLLGRGVCVWVRVPLVEGVNDSIDEMKKIKDIFDKYGYPEKIELLPYHAMGESKYAALGKEFIKFETPSNEKIEMLQKIFA